jgi:hypothetical protein
MEGIRTFPLKYFSLNKIKDLAIFFFFFFFLPVLGLNTGLWPLEPLYQPRLDHFQTTKIAISYGLI